MKEYSHFYDDPAVGFRIFFFPDGIVYRIPAEDLGLGVNIYPIDIYSEYPWEIEQVQSLEWRGFSPSEDFSPDLYYLYLLEASPEELENDQIKNDTYQRIRQQCAT